MAASARPARRPGGACGAKRCLLVSALLTLAWLAWGREGATRGGLDLAVSDRVHAAVRPHVQRADLAGFVAAHARHDPVRALERRTNLRTRGGTRRHGAGFGSEGESSSDDARLGAFPEAWEEGVGDVGGDDDPLPGLGMLAPANPEPPSPPPRPPSAHRDAAPGSHLWRPPLPAGDD